MKIATKKTHLYNRPQSTNAKAVRYLHYPQNIVAETQKPASTCFKPLFLSLKA